MTGTVELCDDLCLAKTTTTKKKNNIVNIKVNMVEHDDNDYDDDDAIYSSMSLSSSLLLLWLLCDRIWDILCTMQKKRDIFLARVEPSCNITIPY